MKMWGYGATTCAFCGVTVYVTVSGDVLKILMRGGEYQLEHPVFCSDECETASALRLDERVNA